MPFNCLKRWSIRIAKTGLKVELRPREVWKVYVRHRAKAKERANFWIYENRVKFEAKLSSLPAGDSRQGGPSGALKARGIPLRRIGADSPGAWLPDHTKPVPQALAPGGRGGSKREVFPLVKLLIFFAGQTLPAMPCSLSSRQAASQTQARFTKRPPFRQLFSAFSFILVSTEKTSITQDSIWPHYQTP